jgi:hypothetical protein
LPVNLDLNKILSNEEHISAVNYFLIGYFFQLSSSRSEINQYYASGNYFKRFSVFSFWGKWCLVGKWH